MNQEELAKGMMNAIPPTPPQRPDLHEVFKDCQKRKPKWYLLATHFALLAAAISMASRGKGNTLPLLVMSFAAMHIYLLEINSYVQSMVVNMTKAAMDMDIWTLEEFKKVIEETRADVARERAKSK